jgi:hypothetical protein
MGKDIHVKDTPYMNVIYWRGLPLSQDGYIRIDVERHFEGKPRSAIRDLVGT